MSKAVAHTDLSLARSVEKALNYRLLLFGAWVFIPFLPGFGFFLNRMGGIWFLLELVSLFFGLNFGIKALLNEQRYKTLGLFFLFLIWYLVMSVAFRSVDELIANRNLIMIPLSRIALLLVFLNVRSATLFAQMLRLIVVAGVAMSLIGISQTLTGFPVAASLEEGLFSGPRNYFAYFLPFLSKEVTFGSGTFAHFNGMGGYLLLIFPIAFTRWIETRKRIDLIAAGIIFLAVFTTFSRGALLSTLIAGIYLYFAFIATRKQKIWITVGLVLFSLLSLTVIGAYIDSTQNATSRVLTWAVATEYAIREPINLFWGYGVFFFKDYVLTTTLQNLHSSFFQILLEMGLIGCVLFFWSIWRIIRKVGKVKTTTNRCLIAILIAFTVSQSLDNNLFGYNGTLLIILVGLFMSQAGLPDHKINWKPAE